MNMCFICVCVFSVCGYQGFSKKANFIETLAIVTHSHKLISDHHHVARAHSCGGGHGVRVFTGVCLVLGIGCAPVLYKKTRAGHAYFSSEKPEAVERGLEAKQKEKYADLIKRNG